MSLITLPNEILFLITESLTVSDLYSLLLTHRVLALALPPILYELAALDSRYVTTALFHGAIFKNNDLIITILTKGRDITVMKDHHNCIILPYHSAPSPCTEETLNFVLSQGPNLVLHQQNLGTCQWHALHWAAWRRDSGFIRTLLAHGADINMKDTSGRTALHDTVWRRDPGIVKILLDQGADMTIRDLYGRTAVDMADAYRCRDILKILLEGKRELFVARGGRGGETGERDSSLTPVLLSVVGQGDEEMVRLLVECGACLEIRDSKKKTPLHVATENGHIAVVQMLLDYGVALNPRDCNRQTPLHLASGSGFEDVARLLIQNGADITQEDSWGKTAGALAADFRRKYNPRPDRLKEDEYDPFERNDPLLYLRYNTR